MAKHTLTPSPFAPLKQPKMPAIGGVAFYTGNTGIRYQGRDDIVLATLPEGTTAAGVFTRSSMPGAPVDWCRRILPKGKARALVVNAGISNVFTGKKGMDAVKATAETAAKKVKCRADEVWISSTGIIGVVPDAKKLTASLSKLKPATWEKAAAAILTTDTFPKLAVRAAKIGSTKVTLGGFIKGSGMIAPDMATMLGYIFTDAKIPAKLLQKIFADCVNPSFNSITVDSDTSTSDTVLLFATGKAKHAPATAASLKDFKAKLQELMIELAQLVVRDGEGISKFVTIQVSGASSDDSARRIGLSVANSPLVKTAIAGEDANWGRIVAAIGKSGEKAARDKTSVRVGGVLIAKNGGLNPAYVEAPTAKYMKGREIEISVDVGVGKGKATVWTCDLTHAYIDINADYRS